jgi:hypothetical protein
MLDTRIVDQDVDATELRDRVFHHLLDLSRVAHIGIVNADVERGAMISN